MFWFHKPKSIKTVKVLDDWCPAEAIAYMWMGSLADKEMRLFATYHEHVPGTAFWPAWTLSPSSKTIPFQQMRGPRVHPRDARVRVRRCPQGLSQQLCGKWCHGAHSWSDGSLASGSDVDTVLPSTSDGSQSRKGFGMIADFIIPEKLECGWNIEVNGERAFPGSRCGVLFGLEAPNRTSCHSDFSTWEDPLPTSNDAPTAQVLVAGASWTTKSYFECPPYTWAYPRNLPHFDTCCMSELQELDEFYPRRWQLASRFMADVQVSSALVSVNDSTARRYALQEYDMRECARTTSMPNWPNPRLYSFFMPRSARTTMFIKVGLVTALYGGFHIGVAWNAEFPSEIERTTWRISSLIIATSGSGYCISVYVIKTIRATIWEHLDRDIYGPPKQGLNLESWLRRIYNWCCVFDPSLDTILGWRFFCGKYPSSYYTTWRIVSKAFALIMLLVFVLARIYIVVEAFASLRKMPADTYRQPPGDWWKVIPHVSW